MDFLGIGPMELLFIVLIALIVLGPKDMLQASRTIGKMLRKFFTSDSWREFRRGMESVKNLPYKMAREAGMDDDLQIITQSTQLDISDLTIPLPEGEHLKTIEDVIKEENYPAQDKGLNDTGIRENSLLLSESQEDSKEGSADIQIRVEGTSRKQD